jgi:long-chain acyl-CoA synthetase
MLSIERILPRARALYPNRPAVNGGDGWLTFEQFGKRVDALAGALAGLGMQQGDRVAVLDLNSARYLEAYYAAAQAGFVMVPLNARLAAPEIEYILNDCAAKVLIAAPPLLPAVEAIQDRIPSVQAIVTYAAGLGKAFDYETLLAAAGPPGKPAAPALSDLAQIYYTSGTTGEPKGVCLTYGNMAVSATDSIVGLGLDWHDCWLHSAPLFHLVDAWAVWAMPLLGAPQIPLHFTPDQFFSVVERWKPTGTALPPTLINLLCTHPKVRQRDLKSLRLIMYGGSPMPVAVLANALDAIPSGYMHAYGITETSGILTLLRPEDIQPRGTPEQLRKTGSAGHAVLSTTIEIMDDRDAILPAGQVGEIVVGGPRVMSGYWNKPKATAEALRGGWYRTGDLGYFDDERNVYVVDRKKDMIISGGENVYSVEVENVLSTHPAVLECAVIGIPHRTWGEAVHAVVVPREQQTLSEAELLTFCRGKIAGYKIPKSVSFSAEQLPKTGPGKIAKRRLRDAFWKHRETKI